MARTENFQNKEMLLWLPFKMYQNYSIHISHLLVASRQLMRETDLEIL